MKIRFRPYNNDWIRITKILQQRNRQVIWTLGVLLIINSFGHLILLHFFTEYKNKETSKLNDSKYYSYMGVSSVHEHKKDTLTLEQHHNLYSKPQNLGLYGIDVSMWQGNINWQETASNKYFKNGSFAIIKATEGINGKDPKFKTNWENARKSINFVGAYHFFVFNENPIEQAKNYCTTVKLDTNDFRPIVDVEFNCIKCNQLNCSKKQLRNNLKSFLQYVEQQYKTEPIIYCNSSFFYAYLTEFSAKYPIWIAQYSSTPPIHFGLNNKLMWQFTSSGKLNGINGYVDFDYINKKHLKQLLIAK